MGTLASSLSSCLPSWLTGASVKALTLGVDSNLRRIAIRPGRYEQSLDPAALLPSSNSTRKQEGLRPKC